MKRVSADSVDQAFWEVEMMKGDTTPSIRLERKQLHLVAKPGLPRAIRARVARVPIGQRHKMVKLGPGMQVKSHKSPDQAAMISHASGRMALGPWFGPFKAYPEAVLPATLYMDPKGVMYESLDMIDAAKKALAAQEDAKISAHAALLAARAVQCGDDAMRASTAKTSARIHRTRPFEAARGVRTRKMMRVMQPR